MDELPTGTVSLLFSDMEGSTALLKRLGPAYASALDGQRQVLRKAWADHGGIELGTEGDSFYVVFPTAEGAVAAATQGQRDLARFEWPEGQLVRVRMGIHTGSPRVHDGGYVGMDVHRAARIAGAAHGGQVLVSSATAGLVGECLPDGVTVKDLGGHQLKDIVSPEHLFQLTIQGLQVDFPPVKSLGASSSLPRPVTPLVGRDGELAELTALVSSPGARLVTLTGAGGSGKTRLGIGVAERLVDDFPDGVYFVPLASTTTAEVMWTSIAGVLGVPPGGRTLPGFLAHVAHRSGLLVLDNLEQVQGGDAVVHQLLEAAPQLVVIATSRRPLHLAGEYEHPVPPLELPARPTIAEVEASGAVQLFVQQARRVRPSFALTPENAADVVAVCRRLDGLPLALELAAARVKLLTPKALLPRLDAALDLAAAGTQGRPTRHSTLRETIAWSYDLLEDSRQAFFRRLGVFSGGADLPAIAAITGDVLNKADPLDLVADLVDASLVSIRENAEGEPRVILLETIRDYAHDLLRRVGEYDTVHLAHANYYLEQLTQLTPRPGAAFSAEPTVHSSVEVEHANFREALRWSFPPGAAGPFPHRAQIGLDLAGRVSPWWQLAGFYAEAREWLERALTTTGNDEDTLVDTPAVADCLMGLANVLEVQGELEQALRLLRRAQQLFGRLGDALERGAALLTEAWVEIQMEDLSGARASVEAAIELASAEGSELLTARAMGELANIEALTGNLERSLELDMGAAEKFRSLGNLAGEVGRLHNSACTLREMGRPGDAYRRMCLVVNPYVRWGQPSRMVTCAEDLAAILADLGAHPLAIRLFAAADASRERNGIPRSSLQQTEIAEPLAAARAALSEDAYQREYQAGLDMTVDFALREATAAPVNLGA